MKSIRFTLVTTILLAAISAVLSLFISSHATREHAVAFHSLFAISIAVAVLNAGAAAGFILGLKNFKTSLRVAYILMCIGFVFLGITFLQAPLLSLADLWDSYYVDYGGVIVPFVASAICLYLGIRQFARLLEVKSLATSFWAASGVAVVMIGITLVAPYRDIGVSAAEARATAAFSIMLTSYLSFAAWAAWLVLKKVNMRLARATRWLFIVLVLTAVAGLQDAVLGLYLSHDHWYQSYGLSILPHAAGGLLALFAAYSFNYVAEDATVSAAGSVVTAAAISAAATLPQENIDNVPHAMPGAPIEVVEYVASLASSPSKVEPLLGGFNRVIARANRNTVIDDEGQKQLAETYIQLEEYLVNTEPLRKFSQDEIRRSVRSKFGHGGQDATFWQQTGI